VTAIRDILRQSVLVASVALGLATVASARTIRVTCRDGTFGVLIESEGHHRKFPDACDFDGAADGVCAFAKDYLNLKCAVAPGPACHDGSVDLVPFPCSDPNEPRLAVPLTPGSRRARAVWVLRSEGLPPNRVIFRCRAARQPVATTTSTTLAGLPSLGGEWDVVQSVSTQDCPNEVPFLPLFTSLRIAQTGTLLRACARDYLDLRGTASSGGFVFDPRGGLEFTGPPDYRVVATVSGTVLPTGESDLRGQYDLTPGDAMQPPPCQVVVTGALVPQVGPPCADHAECIAHGDACSRCLDGKCTTRPPFCLRP